MARRVLVIDDEKGVREAIRQVLEYEGIEVETASSGTAGLKAYPQFHPHLVFLDVKMAGMDGLETLRALRELDPHALVVMISGHGTIETAVESTQLGAYDFLEKPLDTDRILLILRNVFEKVELESEFERLQGSLEHRHEIVGDARSLREVLEVIEKVAPTNARVLITGENGSGKELVARAIHRRDPGWRILRDPGESSNGMLDARQFCVASNGAHSDLGVGSYSAMKTGDGFEVEIIGRSGARRVLVQLVVVSTQRWGRCLSRGQDELLGQMMLASFAAPSPIQPMFSILPTLSSF